MNKQYFQSPAWYQAINLNERIASLHAVPDYKPKDRINPELAQRRMEKWQKSFRRTTGGESPAKTDSTFKQRLELDSIDEDELLQLLGEPIEAVQERFPKSPQWLLNLVQAFSHPNANAYSSDSLPPLEVLKGQEISLFLYAIEPLIRQGCDRLHQGVKKLTQTYSYLPFDLQTITEILFVNLSETLLMMSSRTIALEVQVARLQGRLQGDTPQERFYSFFQQLRQPEQLLSLLEEYPVLARQLTICIDQWVKFSLEFLQHLCMDWKAIQTTFSPESDPGTLVALQGGAGDTHRGGRSVIVAYFSSGFKLVYKPRSLATDVHFQQLLTWINQQGNHPPFRTLKILNRDSYGWVEFVTPKTCTSEEEIHHFYQRQGGYLALLYALEATDFHHENLIAAGEHPVLIDLESLFHPHAGKINSNQSELLANETLNQSVLGIGLLPQRIWSKAEYNGIDLSGLGAKEGQLMPSGPSWQGIGTDDMHLVREQRRMTSADHQPTLNGTEVNMLDYAEAISAGFIQVYQLLLKHRKNLLSKMGPLACFAQDEVRVIMRNTQLYGLLQGESFHPDLLRDALKRDQLFDRLWFGIEPQTNVAQVIRAEREDLWRGDLPIFTTRPNSRDLFTSSGEKITNFFDESGMTLVKHRLEKLSKADLTQQIRLIEASLATAMSSKQAYWYTSLIVEPQNGVNQEQLMATAQAIGDRLEELAIVGKNDATWIGVLQTNGGHLSLASLGVDLYDGLPGIVLFLATLDAITQQKRYSSLVEAALTTLQRHIKPGKSSLKSIGGFDGWGGLIYSLTHLSQLWNKPELLAEAEEIVNFLPPLIEQDKGLDIIWGAAGCIISLLRLYRCSPSESTLAAAIKCGEHLIAKAQSMTQGIAWVTPMPVTQPLTGLAHGAAGIAWALLELCDLTGEKRYRTAAIKAISYERSLFRPEVSNWPDFRNFTDTVLADKDNQHTCATAWCHGAPGIGLARLLSLAYLDDDKIRSEINTALHTTLAHGFGSNHSLCHGDLGNLEFLLQASQILDDPQWKSYVERLAAIILESIERHGWLCGVPLGVETPGLMTGLAGIGYQLLRLAEPERVPSVLALEPPKLISAGQKTTDWAMAV